jgi:eukaryotic-like serine/threonine-protein kinase
VQKCATDGFAFVSPEDLEQSDGDPFLGATVGDRYVVLGRLGAGSMGTVYRACHLAMGRDVALKILRSDRAFDANAKARFAREARAMSMLTSPHTCTVFDFGEAEVPSVEPGGEVETSLFLALELLDGESLGQRLKREGRLGRREAARICIDAAKSLAEAHEKGIIHRDLKPDNLFLVASDSGDGVCKLLDFGIAKVLRDGAQEVDALETQAGTVFGTPRYMSPEQAQGKPLDARSDIYSLGVLLYHMLTGRAPFADDDAVVVMAHHIKSTPIPPAFAAPDAGIPVALGDFVMRCLAKDPAKRPAHAAAFIRDLEEVLQETPTGEGLALAASRAVRPSSLRVAAVVLGTALVVIGAGFMVTHGMVARDAGAPAAMLGVASAGRAAATRASRAASEPAGAEPAAGTAPRPPSSSAEAGLEPSAAPTASLKAAPVGPKAGPRPKYVLFD